LADLPPAPPPGRRPRRQPKTPRPPLPIPEWSKPERLIVGRLLAPHGYDGACRLEILTDYPERLIRLRRVYIGDEPRPRRVTRAQLHPPYALMWLAGVTDEQAASALRGALVRIDHDQAAPLGEGEYYHWQLIGARVVDEAGAPLGVLIEIIQTGANDVYVLRTPPGGELLLPAIQEVIRHVDVDQGVITARLLPGLGE
jgi:16S rRNA processing protein RimM